MQEVDFKIARENLVLTNGYTRLLTPTGYGRGGTRVDACCIFYKSKDWRILGKEIVWLDNLASMGESFRRGNYGIIAWFQHKSNLQKTVVICNQEYEYVKLYQARYLCEKSRSILDTLLKKGLEPHLIFCGDLNSKPGGLVHKYITSGEICTKNILYAKSNNLECPLRNLCLKSIHSKCDKND